MKKTLCPRSPGSKWVSISGATAVRTISGTQRVRRSGVRFTGWKYEISVILVSLSLLWLKLKVEYLFLVTYEVWVWIWLVWSGYFFRLFLFYSLKEGSRLGWRDHGKERIEKVPKCRTKRTVCCLLFFVLIFALLCLVICGILGVSLDCSSGGKRNHVK